MWICITHAHIAAVASSSRTVRDEGLCPRRRPRSAHQPDGFISIWGAFGTSNGRPIRVVKQRCTGVMACAAQAHGIRRAPHAFSRRLVHLGPELIRRAPCFPQGLFLGEPGFKWNLRIPLSGARAAPSTPAASGRIPCKRLHKSSSSSVPVRSEQQEDVLAAGPSLLDPERRGVRLCEHICGAH